MEKYDEKRSEYLETIESYPHYRLYFVDECGLDKYLYREYGCSLKGVPVIGKTSGKKFKRTNIVAAKNGDRIIAPMIYDCSTDSVLFEHWFKNMLLKSIPRYSVIVLDNATFHSKKRLRELAIVHDCDVIFLPPYSPDLNPIENFWASLKSRLRKILPFFDSFHDALWGCFQFNLLYSKRKCRLKYLRGNTFCSGCINSEALTPRSESNGYG